MSVTEPALRKKFEDWIERMPSGEFEALAQDIVVEHFCSQAGPGAAQATKTREGENDGGYDFAYEGPYAGLHTRWRGSVKKTSARGTKSKRIERLKGLIRSELQRYPEQCWLLVTSLALTTDDRADLSRYATERGAIRYEVIDRHEVLTWGLKHPWLLHRHGFDAESCLRDWPRPESGLTWLVNEPLPEPWEEVAKGIVAEARGPYRLALAPAAPATLVAARVAHLLRERDVSTVEGEWRGGDEERLRRDLDLINPERVWVIVRGNPPGKLDEKLGQLCVLEIHGRFAKVPARRTTEPLRPLEGNLGNLWFIERFGHASLADRGRAWHLAAEDPAEAALVLVGQSSVLDLRLKDVVGPVTGRPRAMRLLFALAMRAPFDSRQPPIAELAMIAGLSLDVAEEIYDALADSALYEKALPPLLNPDGQLIPDPESPAASLRPVVGMLVGRETGIPRQVRPSLAEPRYAIRFAASAGNSGPLLKIIERWTEELDAAPVLPPELSELLRAGAALPELQPLLCELLSHRVALAEEGQAISSTEWWSTRELLRVLLQDSVLKPAEVVSLLDRSCRLCHADAKLTSLLASNDLRFSASRAGLLLVAFKDALPGLSPALTRTLPEFCTRYLKHHSTTGGVVGNVGIFSAKRHDGETRPSVRAAGDLLLALTTSPDGPTRVLAWRKAGDVWRDLKAPPVYLDEITSLVGHLARAAEQVLSKDLEPARWVEAAEIERTVLWFASLSRLVPDAEPSPILTGEALVRLIQGLPRDPAYLLYRLLFHNESLVIDPGALAEQARTAPLTKEVIAESCARVAVLSNDSDFAAGVARDVAATLSGVPDLVDLLTKLGKARTSHDPLRGHAPRGEFSPTTLTAVVEQKEELAWELIVSRAYEDLPSSIREFFLIAARPVFQGRLSGLDALDGRSARQNLRLRKVLRSPETSPAEDLSEILDFALEVVAPTQRAALLHQAAAHEDPEARAAIARSTLRWANAEPTPDPRDVAAVLARLSQSEPHLASPRRPSRPRSASPCPPCTLVTGSPQDTGSASCSTLSDGSGRTDCAKDSIRAKRNSWIMPWGSQRWTRPSIRKDPVRLIRHPGVAMRGRIVSVRIQSYRCIEDLTFKSLRHLTLLVGANGSGKSSVLDAIQFIADIVRDPGSAWSGEKRGVLGVEHIPYAELAWREGPMRFELQFEVKGRGYTYRLVLAKEPRSKLPVITEEVLIDETGTPLLERDQNGARVFEQDGKTYPVAAGFLQAALSEGLKDNSPFLRIIDAAKFIAGITLLCPNPPLMRGGNKGATTPDRYGRDLKWRLHQLLTEANRPDRFHDDLNRHLSWRKVKTPLRDGHVQVEIFEAGQDLPISMDTASDGSIVYTYLAALANHPPTGVSVLLIDEPATGLFRRASQLTAMLLEELSVSTQVMLTTQSTGLMDELGSLADAFALRRVPGKGSTSINMRNIEGYDELVSQGGLSDVLMSWADYPRNEERLDQDGEE